MKLFQTSQHEVINTSMITNIKPIHNKEIGDDAERLYTREEFSILIHAANTKKCRVVNQEVRWSQVELPVVAYKVTTTNGSVVISVPDYEKLIKILSDWITGDAGEDEDEYDVDEYDEDDDASTDPCVKLTQAVFNHPKCPTWAKWAAIDEDGGIFVFEEKPKIIGAGHGDSNYECISYVPGWQRTLIKREE